MAAQQQMSLDCEEAFQKNNLQLLAEHTTSIWLMQIFCRLKSGIAATERWSSMLTS
jgi:hypothetical protein